MMPKTKAAKPPLVAYVGPMSFPEGGAAARRILGNALSLRQSGYNVVIGSGQSPKNNCAGIEYCQDIPFHSLNERTAEHLPTLLKHLVYFGMGRKTVAWLSRLDPRPCAVILYSGYSPYLIRLRTWCRRNGVPLIFDAVEWYDPSNTPGGRFSPYRWNIELAMRHLSPRVGQIIVVSTYLERYYRSRNCRTITIPPTLDVQAVPSRTTPASHAPIILGYAGNPGRKDLLNNILEGIMQFDPSGEKIRFKVTGLALNDFLALPAFQNRGLQLLPPNIENIGKVPQPEAMSLIRDVDFSVLLRPPRPYAQAGFPTKVVESLAVGTPVICNITSDLGSYIHDGKEGIICKDHSSESFSDALARVTQLSLDTRQDMRTAARRQAERSFDFRRYVRPLQKFMHNLVVPGGNPLSPEIDP